MNYGLKVRVFQFAAGNIALTSIRTLLGGSARVVGLFCFCPLAPGNEAIANLVYTCGGIDYPFVQINCATTSHMRGMWFGIGATNKDINVQAFATALNPAPVIPVNSAHGMLPIAPPSLLEDQGGLGAMELKLVTGNVGFGTTMLFYTDDPPVASGENSG